MGAVNAPAERSRQTGDRSTNSLSRRLHQGGVAEDSGVAYELPQASFDDVFKVYGEILRTPAFARINWTWPRWRNTGCAAQRRRGLPRAKSRVWVWIDSPLAHALRDHQSRARRRLSPGTKYYQPNGVLLGVSGDFSSAR
jgi:hypothetical protein